jgi:hypothetical protein
VEAAKACPRAEAEKRSIDIAQGIEPFHGRVDPAVHRDIHRTGNMVFRRREIDKRRRLLCKGGEVEEQRGGQCRKNRQTTQGNTSKCKTAFP